MVIPGEYTYCQSYSDVRGYADKGWKGGRVVIHGLYAYCQSYSDNTWNIRTLA